MKVIKIVFLSSLLFIGIFVFVNYDFNLTYKENQRIINYKRLIKASAKNDYDKAKYLLDIGTDLYPDNWLIHNYFTSDVRDTPILLLFMCDCFALCNYKQASRCSRAVVRYWS